MLGGLLRRLFGGKGREPSGPAATEEYQGYTLTADPVREGSVWRVAGRIQKGTGPDARVHEFCRADTGPDREEIAATALRKARRLVDEQGERLFDDNP